MCVCVPHVLVNLAVLHSLIRYGDAVRELDHGVGVILDTVRRLGLASDTIAVFSSDNGAATYAKTAGNITHVCLSVDYSCHLEKRKIH